MWWGSEGKGAEMLEREREEGKGGSSRKPQRK